MKKLLLTRGYIAYVDDADYDRVNVFSWYAIHGRNTVYARRTFVANGKQAVQSLHRFILSLSDSEVKVDHIDHDGLNNCRSNLRVCNSGQNLANQPKHHGKSRFKGVYQSAGKWRAQIRYNSRIINLGYFASEVAAARAYDLAAFRLRGEFACLNFPREAA